MQQFLKIFVVAVGRATCQHYHLNSVRFFWGCLKVKRGALRTATMFVVTHDSSSAAARFSDTETGPGTREPSTSMAPSAFIRASVSRTDEPVSPSLLATPSTACVVGTTSNRRGVQHEGHVSGINAFTHSVAEISSSQGQNKQKNTFKAKQKAGAKINNR